ncbi:MAG TPA: hypothetical protein VF012_04380 [Nocardioidaceae bacterium]
MTSTVSPKTRKPPSPAARRTGYVFSILINAALLFGINVWPGWDILPFLSDDFTKVVGLVNVSLWVSLAVQVVYLFHDAKPVKPLLDVVTLAVSIVVGIRMWQVFPFDFGDQTFDWELLFRILLGVGIVGMGIAIIVNLVSAFRDTPSRS